MNGSGTEEDPYQITNSEELQSVNEDSSGHYEIVCDINAKKTIQWNKGRGFEPIGSRKNPFEGTFDGNDYKITNLYIDRTDSHYVGLFSYNEGQIRNVSLTNTTVKGNNCVGSLVGHNRETVESSYVGGDITGSKNVGGLVGYNSGTVKSSYVGGDITGSKDVGGLVGFNLGIVESSYVRDGDVSAEYRSGSLLGVNSGELDWSYSVEDTTIGDDLVGYNKNGNMNSSFLFSDIKGDGIPEDFDLVISRDNCQISYAVYTNTLYLELDNKNYSFSGVSSAKVNKLAQRLDEDIVKMSDDFRATVVAI